MDDLPKLLKELDHHDPHFRQNSVRFLSQKYTTQYNNLKQEEKVKIIDGLISKLDTKEDSLDVKGVTVREFGKMAKFLKEEEIVKVFSKIVSFITDENVEGKDIYVLCIKEILKQSKADSCYVIGKTVIPQLMEGINHKNNLIKELSFDAFNDFINTFNYILIRESDSIINNKDLIYKSALECLKIDNVNLRKICSMFLGNFSLLLKKDSLNNLLKMLVDSIDNTKVLKVKNVFITTLIQIIKTTSSKLLEFFNSIFFFLNDYCSLEYLKEMSNSSTDDYNDSNELVESCLGLIEIFSLKLRNEIKGLYKKMIKIYLNLIFYDPFYSYDNVESSDNNYGGGYDEYYGDYMEYGGSADNDDTSWRVRRAAIKGLCQFVKSKMLMDKEEMSDILVNLVIALRERDENTKLDVIVCISEVLNALVVEVDDELQRKNTEDHHQFVKKTSSIQGKDDILVKITESLSKELATNNKNHKTAILKMIGSVSLVEAALMFSKLPSITSNLTNIFNESTENAINILNIIIKLIKGSAENTELLETHFELIIGYLSMGMSHDYYKVNVEAVKCLSLLVSTIHNHYIYIEDESKDKLSLITKNFYNLLYPKFIKNDIDQELKIVIIGAVGNLLIYLGKFMDNNTLSQIMDIFYEKNNNENLRSSIFGYLIKTFRKNSVNLSQHVMKYVLFVQSNFKKHNIQVQYQSLELLYTMFKYNLKEVQKFDSKITNEITDMLLNHCHEDSLSNLIFEVLNILFSNIKIDEKSVNLSISKVIEVLDKAGESNHYHSVFAFLEIALTHLDHSSIQNILNNIISSSLGNISSIKAKIVSMLAFSVKMEDKVLEITCKKLKEKTDDETFKSCLNCVGEISLVYKSNSEIYPFLETLLNSSKEDIKANIALALGKAATNNIAKFIESIEIVQTKKKELIGYFFISIREFLNVISTRMSVKEDDLNSLNKLFEILKANSKNNEDKVKILSGESLGLLSLVSVEFLNKLINLLEDENEDVKSSALYSLKYIFSSKIYSQKELDKAFALLIESLKSESLKIKSMAFSSLTSLAFNYCSLIGNDMKYFESIFSSFEVNYQYEEKLTETIDLGGGVKIKNDKGLNTRKSIFTCIKLFLEHIPHKLKFERTIPLIIEGLKDVEDVQSLATSSLLKLSNSFSNAFVTVFENVIEIFSGKLKLLKENTMIDEAKKKSFYEDVERFLLDLSKVNDIQDHPKYNEFKHELEKAALIN